MDSMKYYTSDNKNEGYSDLQAPIQKFITEVLERIKSSTLEWEKSHILIFANL
jgi:hypothetical protein